MEDLNKAQMEEEEEEDEARDQVSNMGFTKELIDEIREKKESNPGMFVSAWQEDDEGIHEKDLENPIEEWLTAAEDGTLDKLKQMYESDNSFLKAKDRDGYTALHRAAYGNHLDVVDFLIESGADVNAKTNDGWTPLHSAANWGVYQVIAKLISAGTDVNATSNGMLTALHLAVKSENEDPEEIFHSVRYLLEAPGVDPSVKCNSGDTPLIIARRSSGRIYNLILDFINRY